MGDNSSQLPFGDEVPFAVDEAPTFGRFARSLLSLGDRKSSLVKNARMVVADLPVNHTEAKNFLPFGLWLDNPPYIRIFIVSYEKAVYSPPYNEASMIISARTLFGRGGHVSWMVVDNDTALIYGREVLACPKKMAEIQYSEENGKVTASVTRQGTRVLSIEAQIKDEEENPGFVFGAKAFNVGGLGQLFALNPIWLFKLEEVIHESYTAQGTLELNDSLYDPIKCVVGEYLNPVPMRVIRMDITSVRYLLPVGIAGPGWFLKTYNMRFR